MSDTREKLQNESFNCGRCGQIVYCATIPDAFYQFCIACTQRMDMEAYSSTGGS